jgi:hypothetical protein
MFALLLIHPEARGVWRRKGPYLAGMLALAIFLPHAAWMVQNHFVTLSYGMERSEDAGGWFTHFKNPILFVLSQGGRLLPVFFVLVPLTGWRWNARPADCGKHFDRAFLLSMVGGPVALHLLLSLATGAQLREIWGSPLWTFVGVMVLVFVRVDLNSRAWQRTWKHFAVVVVGFGFFSLAKVVLIPNLLRHPSRVHFPGKRLTHEVAARWEKRVGKPIPVTVGECWLASNIGCYAKPRPSVYFSKGMGNLAMDPDVVPWTGDEDVRRRGGVLIWDAAAFGDHLPKELKSRFPQAEEQLPLELAYECRAKIPAARVGIAFQLPCN